MSNKECLNPDYAYTVVEYENGLVKNKYQFPTENLAKTFIKTMGKNFRYKGQKKKMSKTVRIFLSQQTRRRPNITRN